MPLHLSVCTYLAKCGNLIIHSCHTGGTPGNITSPHSTCILATVGSNFTSKDSTFGYCCSGADSNILHCAFSSDDIMHGTRCNCLCLYLEVHAALISTHLQLHLSNMNDLNVLYSECSA